MRRATQSSALSNGGSSSFQIYKRALLEVRPYWPHLGAILVLGLLATPVALLLPLPLKLVVDSVIGSSEMPEFLWYLGGATASTSKNATLAFAVLLLLAVTVLNLLQRFGQ